MEKSGVWFGEPLTPEEKQKLEKLRDLRKSELDLADKRTAAITPTTMTDIPADYEYIGDRDIDPFDYGVDEETAWAPGVGADTYEPPEPSDPGGGWSPGVGGQGGLQDRDTGGGGGWDPGGGAPQYDPPSAPADTGGWSPAAGGGGGDGGGGGKIVCTMMNNSYGFGSLEIKSG